MTTARRQKTQRKQSAAMSFQRVNDQLIRRVDRNLRLNANRPAEFTVLTLTKGGAHPKQMIISSITEKPKSRPAHTTWGKERPKVIGGMLPQRSRASDRLVDEWRKMGLKSESEVSARLSVILAREKPETLKKLLREVGNPKMQFPDGFKRVVKDFFNSKTGRK